MDLSPTGFQIGVLGACSLRDSLKNCSVRCVAQTLHSSGRIWELGFGVPSWLYYTGPGWECVSAFPTCFDCGYFLIHLVWRSHSASFWFSLRITLRSCTFGVSIGRGKFRSLPCGHLVPSLVWGLSLMGSRSLLIVYGKAKDILFFNIHKILKKGFCFFF